MKVSVIIPTLNEAKVLEGTLRLVQSFSPYEIIVSDAGSSDDTLCIAERMSAKVVTGAKGRGPQMNLGAENTQGDLLLFLHADTKITETGYQKMIRTMEDSNIIGGAFSLKIDSDCILLKMISRAANWRSRNLHLVYGDQAIFVRRDVFLSIGGFPTVPICEDLEFYQSLKNAGPVRLLPDKSLTSARRWQAEGVIFTTLRNFAIASAFILGFSPRILSKWYPERR